MKVPQQVLRSLLNTRNVGLVTGNERIRTDSLLSRGALIQLQLKSCLIAFEVPKVLVDFDSLPEQSYFIPYGGEVGNQLGETFPDLPKHLFPGLIERVRRAATSDADLENFHRTNEKVMSEQEFAALKSDMEFAKQQYEFRLEGSNPDGHDACLSFDALYNELLSFNLVDGDFVYVVGAGSEALAWCVGRVQHQQHSTSTLLTTRSFTSTPYTPPLVPR